MAYPDTEDSETHKKHKFVEMVLRLVFISSPRLLGMSMQRRSLNSLSSPQPWEATTPGSSRSQGTWLLSTEDEDDAESCNHCWGFYKDFTGERFKWFKQLRTRGIAD